MSTQTDIVADGVTAFANAENAALSAQQTVLLLRDIFTRANAAVMMGALETQQMITDAKAAAGHMAQGEAIIRRLHIQATDIAKVNNVDVPAPAGGGPR